ncbi:MAG: hypothetical protein WC516_06575 [Patescibacteria group bacterium]|jgi:hypothetical protein
MYNPNLYLKSILFEIVNKKNPSIAEDAFTLTIPPESFEIVQSQRITRTNTFGGVFEDDYGLGTAKITISGNTGNSELRSTFIPGKGSPQQYTGQQAIQAIRDKIIRYKVNYESRGLENFEIRMYDLSSVTIDILSNINVAAGDAWIVSLDDCKISKSKEKPLWYSYSLEILGIKPLGVYRKEKPATEKEPSPFAEPYPDVYENVALELNQAAVKVKVTKDWLKDGMGSLKRCLNAVSGAFAWGQNLMNSINNVFELISDLENQVEEYVHAAGNIVTTGFGVYKRLFEVAKFPGAVAKAVMQETVSVMNELKDTVEYSAAITASLGDDYLQIAQLANETQRIAAQIVAFGKSSNVDTEITINVNGTDITIYGIRSYTVSDGETLEQIGINQYGDPSLSTLLLMFNGVSNDDLYAGMIIQLPQTVRSSLNEDNEIYALDRSNQFGVDARVDVNGKIVFSENSDFATVSGEKNMTQAINLRLNESLGKRLYLTTYGLATSVGNAKSSTAPMAYITTNILDTLKQDPRIQSVDNIRVNGENDVINVSLNIHTIVGQLSYKGVI